MNERSRPPRLHPGPLPTREPNPDPLPGMKRVIFHLDVGGQTGVSFRAEEIDSVRESIGRAWNSSEGQMFTVADQDGRPSLLINLSKVHTVEIR